MSVELVLNVISVALSLGSILIALAVRVKVVEVDEEGESAFSAVGADMGNHEFRIDQLEDKLHIPHVHAPSVVGEDELSRFEGEGGATYGDDFAPINPAGVGRVDSATLAKVVGGGDGN